MISGIIPAACIALKIRFAVSQTNDIMEPMLWQIEDIPGLQHHFVRSGAAEFGIVLQQVQRRTMAPIDLGVTAARVFFGVEVDVFALVRMG